MKNHVEPVFYNATTYERPDIDALLNSLARSHISTMNEEYQVIKDNLSRLGHWPR